METKIVIGYKPIKKDPKHPYYFGNVMQIVPNGDWHYFEEKPEFYEKIYASITEVA